MKRIGKLFFIFNILLFLFLILNRILNISIFQIQSGSMMPKINIGDIVITYKKEEYKENDIITYKKNEYYYITHRIIKIVDKGYITKGDFNNIYDEDVVKLEQIKGKVIFSSKVLGIIYKYKYYLIGVLIFLLFYKKGENYACKDKEVF